MRFFHSVSDACWGAVVDLSFARCLAFATGGGGFRDTRTTRLAPLHSEVVVGSSLSCMWDDDFLGLFGSRAVLAKYTSQSRRHIVGFGDRGCSACVVDARDLGKDAESSLAMGTGLGFVRFVSPGPWGLGLAIDWRRLTLARQSGCDDVLNRRRDSE